MTRSRSWLRRRLKPLADASPEEAAKAVGGWFVLNDWSARDVQAEGSAREHLRTGREVEDLRQLGRLRRDHADEMPDWQAATGRVRVDGELGAPAPPPERRTTSVPFSPTPQPASDWRPATRSRAGRSLAAAAV